MPLPRPPVEPVEPAEPAEPTEQAKPKSVAVRRPGLAPAAQGTPAAGTVDAAVPIAVRAAAAWAWRLLLLAFTAVLVGWVLLQLRIVTFAVVAALLLAALLQPAVATLRRLGVPRVLAALVVFLSGIAGLAVLGWLVVSSLANGISDIGASVSGAIEQLRGWLSEGPLALSQDQVNGYIDQIQSAVRDNLAAGALSTAYLALDVVSSMVIALFTLFFFLHDGRRVWRWVVRVFPGRVHQRVDEAGMQAWDTLTNYVRGVVIVAFLDGSLTGLALLVIGVPLVLPLAVLVFLGAFVPLIGAFVAGGVAVAVALVTKGVTAAVLTLIAVVAVQQLDGNVFQPFLLGRLVKVHPVGIVLAVTVGTLVAGVGGAVVAVPLVAVANTVIIHLAGRGAQSSDEQEAPETSPA
jgi:predicted PurR-regulated permease PerM